MNSNIYKNICEKALCESAKICKKNIANGTDIIEITIENNVAHLSKITTHDVFIFRQNIVLDFVNKACKLLNEPINIVINIGLHDSYNDNLGIMVFSTTKNADNTLIPDLYSMMEYSGKLNTKDNLDFQTKENKAIFIGWMSGNENFKYNERLQLCNVYINNNNVKCYINNDYAFDKIQELLESLEILYPNCKHFLSNGLSIETQRHYKYIINVDGNTCSWDRIPWILNSNSLCLKKKSNNVCWYYDFMLKNEHYVEFDDDSEIEHIINATSIDDCNRIISNANQFCEDYLNLNSHIFYMSTLILMLSKY